MEKDLKYTMKKAGFATDANFIGAFKLYDKRKGVNVLDTRFYMSRSGNTVWCRAWYSGGYGIGSARGYGYDKLSAAFVDALRDMGVDSGALHAAGVESGIGMATALEKFRARFVRGRDIIKFSAGA